MRKLIRKRRLCVRLTTIDYWIYRCTSAGNILNEKSLSNHQYDFLTSHAIRNYGLQTLCDLVENAINIRENVT